MRVGILGSGLMGGKLGTIFARAGHEVVFSYARNEPKLTGLAREAKGKARTGTPREAAQEADAVLLAVHWSRMEDVLNQTGDLSGKVIVTCSLPMNEDNTELVVAHTASPSRSRCSSPVFVARRAKSYAISVDTLGKLRWPDGDLEGDHVICVVSEQVPEDYLVVLRVKGISYIVSGTSSVDLATAVNRLGEHFGIRILLLEGGGHINGAFLQADLVDEVSLLVVPGIDGRHDVPAVFDGVSPSRNTAVPLRLKSVERRGSDALWIRYEVVRS